MAVCLTASLAACGNDAVQQAPNTGNLQRKTETEPEDKDTVTVSTAGELIAAIAPDAHIILKPGDYNFSRLTEEEIASCSEYVRTDVLPDAFWVYQASNLILEAEESKTAQLVTEEPLADVMTLADCDGAVLKGLVLGHEVEPGYCDADVLRIELSQDVTVEDCELYGCGVTGVSAEYADRLTVTGTEIYDCSGSIFALSETRSAIFDRCRFYRNNGMFGLWESTEILVRDTEIYNNYNNSEELPDYSGSEMVTTRLTFQGCTFRDNPGMGGPGGLSQRLL